MVVVIVMIAMLVMITIVIIASLNDYDHGDVVADEGGMAVVEP